MEHQERCAVLLNLLNSMKDQGSWGGETHLQKATYFLQSLGKVDLGFEYILYKHGPFSFDLRETILDLRANGRLSLEIQDYRYGPSLCVSEAGQALIDEEEGFLNTFQNKIIFFSKQLGKFGVTVLERLATALFVTLSNSDVDVETRSERLHELKPHISQKDATKAIDDIDQIISKSEKILAA